MKKIFLLMFLSVAAAIGQQSPSKSLALEKLLEKTPEELEAVDIGAMNLICADGLPGSPKLDLSQSMALLDDWAAKCKVQIDRNYHRYRDNPGEYLNSEGFFKMVMMILTLQEDMKAHYNPAMIGPVAMLENPDQSAVERDLADDSYFKDAKDVFISGLLSDTRMGTCSSMPVLYIAVGRRLGFPLKLVLTKGHCFVRWDDAKEKFNIEGSGRGVDTHEDDYYRKWPLPISQAEIDSGELLKSLTPSEELGAFLEMRGDCLTANNRPAEALLAKAQAMRYRAGSRNLQIALARAAEGTVGGAPPSPQPMPVDLDEVYRLNQQNTLRPQNPGNLSRPNQFGP